MQPGRQESHINTGGGTFVDGNVSTRVFVGRDLKIDVTVISPSVSTTKKYEIQQALFHPSRPYTVDDEAFFGGRNADVELILSNLRDRQVRSLAIYGPADVGKTSLLEAGVIPQLARNEHLVILLQDYSFPTLSVCAALVGNAAKLGHTLDPSLSMAVLAEEIVNRTGQKMVLILDQFERYFFPSIHDDEREIFQSQLEQILAGIQTQFFQIIISIRDDFQAKLDCTWGVFLPGLRQTGLHLKPLTKVQAKQVIIQSLRSPLGMAFEEEALDQTILPDLDSLDSLDNKLEDSILPSDLQIVCYCLYNEARARDVHPNFNKRLYEDVSKRKGAEQIVDAYFDQLLQQIADHQRPLARSILTEMVDPLRQFWVSPGELEIKDASLEEIESVMRLMTDANMLIWHQLDGKVEYAFASNSIKSAAGRIAGPEVIKRQQIRSELEYAWRAWISYDEWASKEQLLHIEQFLPLQACPPERALFLLCSSVRLGTPCEKWLDLLKKTEGSLTSLLQIEEKELDFSNLSTRQNQLCLLLGVDKTISAENGFGPIALSAVKSDDANCRETAALVLWAAYGQQSLGRFQAAMQSTQAGVAAHAELRGILSDISPEIALENRSLPQPLRFLTWWWRFRRRTGRELIPIIILSLGGGFGSGLFLGLLRALIAWVVGDLPGSAFFTNFNTGVFLGIFLIFGLLVGRLILLPAKKDSFFFDRSHIFLSVICAGVGFALMHTLINSMFNLTVLINAPLILPMALLGGVFLGYSLSDQPVLDGSPIHIGSLLRIGLVTMIFAIIQLVFIVTKDYGYALLFVRGGEFYRSMLPDNLLDWHLDQVLNMNSWYQIPAIIDSAMTGVALALGSTLGLNISTRWYCKWRQVVDQMVGFQKGE
jgi:hypothetical protein